MHSEESISTQQSFTDDKLYGPAESNSTENGQRVEEVEIDAPSENPVYTSVSKSPPLYDARESGETAVHLYDNDLYNNSQLSSGHLSESDHNEELAMYEEINDTPYYTEAAPMTSTEVPDSQQTDDIYEEITAESTYHVLSEPRVCALTESASETESDSDDNSGSSEEIEV